MREPLLLPLAALAGGILVSQAIAFGPRESVGVCIVFAVLAIAAHTLCRVWLARGTTLIALTFAGIALEVAHRPGSPPQIDGTSQEILILAGCVVEPPVLSADREQFLLELAPQAYARVSLSLREGEPIPKLRYGQKVEVEARVRAPRNFGNPGAFNYVRFLARQNVYWTASVRAGTPVSIMPGQCGAAWLRVIYGLRVAALERIERLYAGDSYANGMMAAILLGDSSKLEKVWTDHFRRTGTYHALVISGLHVTVLAGVLLFLLRLCMLNELAALVVAALAAWLYAAVSGWSAPVIRAAGGFTLYLGCRYFFRRGRVLNLLAAVGLAYLIYDPGQLFDASFQLSFLSVAAIGAFAAPIIERTTQPYAAASRGLGDKGSDPRVTPRGAAFRVEMRLLAETVALWTPVSERRVLLVLGWVTRLIVYAGEMVLISATVQVALALPMVLYFHRISITGLSANILIVPLLSIVVPLGFGAIFTGWHWLAWLANALLGISEWVARLHARWEPSLRTPDPPVWLAAAFVAALMATAILLRRRNAWRWPALALAMALFALIFASPFPPLTVEGSLELTAIDVGQGDALFVGIPGGKTMIVDTGGILAFGRRTKPKMDIGEDVVSPYLWSRRIRRVDVIAVTHAHEDHIGGLRALLENFRPAELWTGATPATEQWAALERRAVELGARIVHRCEGEQAQFGRARVAILAPVADYQPAAAAKNNDSLVMRLEFGEHSFLLTGDVEKPIEGRLVAAGVLGRTTVLKVAHHGSRTSSTDAFLSATRPAIALISEGFENSFHHPHPDVIGRLEQQHTAIYRTDQSGLVSVLSDGHRLAIRANVWDHGAQLLRLPVFTMTP